MTDAYCKDLHFMHRVENQLNALPAVAVNGIADAETFDANQNEFTQVIECESRYGVEQDVLDHYYSFCIDYKIVSPFGVGKAGFQETSGEPETLVNN